jgi:hypothetical protein
LPVSAGEAQLWACVQHAWRIHIVQSSFTGSPMVKLIRRSRFGLAIRDGSPSGPCRRLDRCDDFDMTIPSYFSDRESGPVPRDRDSLSDNTRNGLYAYVGTCINKGWLAEEFPEHCKDGNQVCGTEINGLGTLIQAFIPGVDWPLWNGTGLSDAQHFDLVEFAAQRISRPSKPSAKDFHSYYKHYHLGFDRAAGLLEFRQQVNGILARGGANYELSEDGQIRRLGSAPVRALLSRLQPNTGDTELDALIRYAANLYMSKDPVERQTALEKLWDGYEHLKTLKGSGSKLQRIEVLISAVTPADLRVRINTEMVELTNIGNQFRIRHMETNKIPVPDSARDYLFTRMGSVLTFLLEANGMLNLED